MRQLQNSHPSRLHGAARWLHRPGPAWSPRFAFASRPCLRHFDGLAAVLQLPHMRSCFMSLCALLLMLASGCIGAGQRQTTPAATASGTYNYLTNADFSNVPESGIPFGWGTVHWGLWYEDFEAFKQGWRMDYDETREGDPSFLLDSQTAKSSPLYFASCITGAPKGSKTFSVWLKTDKPGSKLVAVMKIGGDHESTVTPT